MFFSTVNADCGPLLGIQSSVQLIGHTSYKIARKSQVLFTYVKGKCSVEFRHFSLESITPESLSESPPEASPHELITKQSFVSD